MSREEFEKCVEKYYLNVLKEHKKSDSSEEESVLSYLIARKQVMNDVDEMVNDAAILDVERSKVSV